MIEKFRMWPYAHKMTKIDLSDNVVIYLNPLYGIYVHSVQEMLVSRESETPDTDWRQKSFFSKHVSLPHKTITGSYRSKKQNKTNTWKTAAKSHFLWKKKLLGLTETEKPCNMSNDFIYQLPTACNKFI